MSSWTMLLSTIKHQFQQPALHLYCTIKETILCAANGMLTQNEMGKSLAVTQNISQHYGDDIDAVQLLTSS